MNILHLAPDLNWAQIFILPLAEKQSIKGNKVYISTPMSNSSSIKSTSVKFVGLAGKLKDPKAHFVGLFRIINIIKNQSISRVYLHTCVDSFFPIIFIRFFTKAQIVYVNHGVPYDGYKGVARLAFQLIECSNITLSHRTISITRSMTGLLQKVNIFNKPIDTLYPGTIAGIDFKIPNYKLLLDKRRFNAKTNQLRIIYVARVEKRKGIYELIEAISKFENTNIHLTIYGSGAHVLDDMSLDANFISIKGYINDLTESYLEADILIVPSYHEGFGQVYLEAASLGVIPVCADILGPTDFIKHGNNGFTVEPKSVKSISRLLKDINDGVYDLEKIRFNAFHSAKKFESSEVLHKNMKEIDK